MTFQPGNRAYGSENRVKFVRDSFVQSLKALGADDQGNWRKLRKITDKVVKLAENGDMGAVKEVFDRLDGKVPQALVSDDDGSPMVLQVVRYVVQPTDTPTELPITIEHDINASSCILPDKSTDGVTK